jgi:hypothetical protein
MSTLLVTDAEVIAHLRLDAVPADLTDIQLKIASASIAIVKYLGEGATFLDENGACVPADVPEDIKIATLFLVGYLYRLRDEDRYKELQPGYLPTPVLSFLWPYRIPPLG